MSKFPQPPFPSNGGAWDGSQGIHTLRNLSASLLFCSLHLLASLTESPPRSHTSLLGVSMLANPPTEPNLATYTNSDLTPHARVDQAPRTGNCQSTAFHVVDSWPLARKKSIHGPLGSDGATFVW